MGASKPPIGTNSVTFTAWQHSSLGSQKGDHMSEIVGFAKCAQVRAAGRSLKMGGRITKISSAPAPNDINLDVVIARIKNYDVVAPE